MHDDLCDRCGADAQELFLVDDSDRSVGYVGSLRLCRRCFHSDAFKSMVDEAEAEMQFRFYAEDDNEN